MEVTKDNFKAILPKIYTAIDNADFIACDTELTGLRRSNARYNELDTPEERYKKVRDSAQEFGLIQFGLSTFRFVKETATYHHSTFCFYLHGRDGEVLCYDNSSLRFLANNDFDFNKLFKTGLPYLSLQEEDEEKKNFTSESLQPPPPSPVKVAEVGAKKFLKESEARMKIFMASENCENVLTFPGTNLTGFFRKLLYNNIAAKHENILVRPILGTTDRSVEVRKFTSPVERTAFLEQERENKLEDKVGFSHVIRRILERGCPLIGHNMVLDLFHTFHKMIKMLPDSLQQFKAEVRATLPTVYDTKLISKDPPFCTDIPITALEKLYCSLCQNYNPPTFEVESGGYSSHDTEGEGKAHDAGYDAFMTGVSFVTMVKHLDGANWKQKSVIKSKHLQIYANRINNMNSHDIPYLNLVGPDVVPNRSQIFCVDCPSTWTTANVYGLFHMMKPIKVVWVNSCFLYVIPLDQLDIKVCRTNLKVVQAGCPPLVRVRLYGDTNLPNPGPAKRKSQSSEDGGGTGEDGTGKEAGQGAGPAKVHEYKRLKSVGSDQLSQMTLESPNQEELPPLFTADSGKVKSANSNAGVFSVPDEW